MWKHWRYIVLTSLLVLCTVVLAVQSTFSNNLKVIACDVGEGDGFLITYKNIQIIIDGGPNNKIVDCVSDNIPFWDREIELVILTHPQLDHFLGLIEIFRIYRVDNFLANNLESSTKEYQVLKNEVVSSDTKVLIPRETTSLKVGLIQLDILQPTKLFIDANSLKSNHQNEEIMQGVKELGGYTTDLDPNEFSISTLLTFNDFEALFTGDISPERSDEVAQILKKVRVGRINYIKVPHHGSKNGLTEELLRVVKPDVAVISAGKNNSYGHPHKEILDMLQKYSVRVYRTDQIGSVTVETDGTRSWVSK